MAEIELPPKTLDDIRKGIDLSKAMDRFLNKAELGGIDVREKRQKVANDRAQLMKMKQAFYPNEPL